LKIDRRPALTVRCRGVSDVMASVRFAREHAVLSSVRGGGHNVAGYGTREGLGVGPPFPPRSAHWVARSGRLPRDLKGASRTSVPSARLDDGAARDLGHE
jgi:hypothetical protein